MLMHPCFNGLNPGQRTATACDLGHDADPSFESLSRERSSFATEHIRRSERYNGYDSNAVLSSFNGPHNAVMPLTRLGVCPPFMAGEKNLLLAYRPGLPHMP